MKDKLTGYKPEQISNEQSEEEVETLITKFDGELTSPDRNYEPKTSKLTKEEFERGVDAIFAQMDKEFAAASHRSYPQDDYDKSHKKACILLVLLAQKRGIFRERVIDPDAYHPGFTLQEKLFLYNRFSIYRLEVDESIKRDKKAKVDFQKKIDEQRRKEIENEKRERYLNTQDELNEILEKPKRPRQ